MAGCQWRVVLGIGLALLVAAPAAASARPAAPRPTPKHTGTPPPAPRRVEQGAAVRISTMRRDAGYRDTFLREFDALTPENEMKMQMLQPRRGSFDFAAADDLVAFAKEHNKRVHGHALVWGLQVPLWLIDHGITSKLGLPLRPLSLPDLPRSLNTVVGDLLTGATGWTRTELLGVMQHHIDTVVRHFGNDVPEWDVVNEPLAPNGTLANNLWRRFIGPDYVELALRAAHAANPRAKLYINDYAVEGPSAKLDGLVALVRDLRARNVPLDGVGLQYHTHIQGFLDEQTLALTMRRLADLGVDVQITEMDVATSLLDGSREQRLARQAVVYGDAARACNAVSACQRFTTWGISDSLSWLGSAEMPLLFDSQYDPKPAFSAVRAAFAPRSVRKPRRARRVSRPSKRKRVGVRKPVRATQPHPAGIGGG
jgi:endo-1,4-beta-xylanase